MSNVKEYALSQALRGVQFPGYKVVEGRSSRKFKNDDIVAKVVTDAGFDPYAHKLLGFTEMQKLLGKQQFNELLAAYIIESEEDFCAAIAYDHVCAKYRRAHRSVEDSPQSKA